MVGPEFGITVLEAFGRWLWNPEEEEPGDQLEYMSPAELAEADLLRDGQVYALHQLDEVRKLLTLSTELYTRALLRHESLMRYKAPEPVALMAQRAIQDHNAAAALNRMADAARNMGQGASPATRPQAERVIDIFQSLREET